MGACSRIGVRGRVGYRLAGVAVLMSLVVGAHLLPGFSSSSLTAELRNSVHFIGFAAIAGILYAMIQTSIFVRVTLILFIIFLLGTLSEFAQSRMEAIDFVDVLRDLGGATVFLIARLLWAGSIRIDKFAMAVRGLSIVIGLSLFAPFLYWMSVYSSYIRQFPLILDFERNSDLLLIEPINSAVSLVDSNTVGSGFSGRVLKVDLDRRGWSGIRISAPVHDWSGYECLTFRAAMQGDSSTRMRVHLSDGPHSGLRSQHLIGGNPVGPEAVEMRLPLRGIVDIVGRPDLDISRVLEIHLIGQDRRPGATMILDDIKLE